MSRTRTPPPHRTSQKNLTRCFRLHASRRSPMTRHSSLRGPLDPFARRFHQPDFRPVRSPARHRLPVRAAQHDPRTEPAAPGPLNHEVIAGGAPRRTHRSSIRSRGGRLPSTRAPLAKHPGIFVTRPNSEGSEETFVPSTWSRLRFAELPAKGAPRLRTRCLPPRPSGTCALSNDSVLSPIRPPPDCCHPVR